MEPPAANIEAVTPERLLGELFDPVVRIWMAAMGRPADHPRAQSFGKALEGHVARAGWRGLVALGPDGPVGFTYGYTGEAGQWWTDLVAARLDEATLRRWMGGHFEFVELHVRPDQQRQGVGGRLHDELLEDLPHKTALLSTMRGATAAYALYRKRGWITLIEDFVFPDQNTDYRIMGLDLSARPRGAR